MNSTFRTQILLDELDLKKGIHADSIAITSWLLRGSAPPRQRPSDDEIKELTMPLPPLVSQRLVLYTFVLTSSSIT